MNKEEGIAQGRALEREAVVKHLNAKADVEAAAEIERGEHAKDSSARPNVFEKLDQAVKDAEGKGRAPCVVAKKTHGETVVVMRLEDFAKWSGWEP